MRSKIVFAILIIIYFFAMRLSLRKPAGLVTIFFSIPAASRLMALPALSLRTLLTTTGPILRLCKMDRWPCIVKFRMLYRGFKKMPIILKALLF